MKTTVISTVISAITFFTFSHANAQYLFEETKITPPEFPATEMSIQGEVITSISSYVKHHVTYPDQFHWAGTEVVQFSVSEHGELSSIKIVNSVSPEIDAQVMDILETTSGNWIPGTIDGKASAMTWEIALVFKPGKDFDLVENARRLQLKANRLMFVKEQPNRALKYYRQAARLLPFEESVLAGKCFCKYITGDEKGYEKDLERIMALFPESMKSAGKGSIEDYLTKLEAMALQYGADGMLK